MSRLILASASPRRRELLAACGLQFEVCVLPVREWTTDPDIRELPAINAALKADAVSAAFPEALVIGADTVVLLDGEALGKPADPADARRMLLRLAGRWHEVMTAVALRRGRDGLRRDFSVTTRVRFKPFGADTVDRYLEQVPVLDKAGAYAIQEHGELLVAELDGELDNVIGLPCRALLEHLTGAGIEPRAAL